MYYGEKFNAVTHLVGAALALTGSVVLVVLAALTGDPWKIAVLSSIDEDLAALLRSHSQLFTFSTVKAGVVDVRDFQTTGVVAFARGCTFYCMQTGRLDIGGHRVRVNDEYKGNCVAAVDALVKKL